MKRRILSIIMALAIGLSLLPGPVLAAEEGSRKTIYLKSTNSSAPGGTPSDSNDGLSAEYPVLSLQKALELAGQGGTIIVLNKISIQPNRFPFDPTNKDLRLDIENVTIQRGTGYSAGALFEITDDTGNYPDTTVTVSLKNVTLIDNTESVADYDTTEFFHVCSGAKLILGEGTVLQNSRNCAIVLAEHRAGESAEPAQLIMNGGKICGAVSDGNYAAAVHMYPGTRFTMNGGEICSNEHTMYNASTVDIWDGAVFDMKGGSIHDNKAVYYNISVESGGTFIMSGDAQIYNNSDAFYNIYNNGTISINGGSISKNTTPFCGGGIYNEGGTVAISNGMISDNSASSSGGGIYNANGTVTIKGGTIKNNTAAYGGGISNMGTANITGGTIIENKADLGGGIHNAGTATIEALTITGNQAASSGGGIYNEGTAEITESTFSGNTAAVSGGGIFNGPGTVNLTDVSITNNHATDSASFGGGIHNTFNGTVTVKNGTIANNSAGSAGGGIYNDATVDFSGDTCVSGNTLTSGTPNNLYLERNRTATVSGPLGANAKIGIATRANPPITIADGKEYTIIGDDVACFFSDEGHTIELDQEKNQLVIVPHIHIWADVWSYDKDGHWQLCTVNGCDGTKGNYSSHILTDKVTLAPTTEAEGIRTYYCTVCEYIWGTTPIPKLHVWAEDWSADSTHHWHDCTVDGCDQKEDYKEHSFDGLGDMECNTCGYVKTVLPNPPAGDDGTQYQIVMETGLSQVPEALQNGENLNTPEKIETELKTVIKQTDNNIKDENTAVYDVELLVSTDNGVTWTKATEDNFPENGLTVTLPYPDGTTSSYKFTVVHMFTIGEKAGKTETPSVTNTKDGIQFTVTGLSPISVGWTEPTPSSGGSYGFSGNKVTVDKPENGKVTANTSSASKGTTVTLTVKPDSGYVLEDLTVVDAKGNEIELTDKGNGKFTFKMPATKVTVYAEFVEKGHICDPYEDVNPNAWYHDAVDYVLENGLMTGYPGGLFGPDDHTSRAMIVTILWRLQGSPVVNYAMNYTDVDQGSWYAEAVRWATSEKIVTGYGDDSFCPENPITREQLAVMLWNYAQYKGYDVSVGENTNILSYQDIGQLSEYAFSAMQWAAGADVINGYEDGTLNPKGNASRAQVAQMLRSFLDGLE